MGFPSDQNYYLLAFFLETYGEGRERRQYLPAE